MSFKFLMDIPEGELMVFAYHSWSSILQYHSFRFPFSLLFLPFLLRLFLFALHFFSSTSVSPPGSDSDSDPNSSLHFPFSLFLFSYATFIYSSISPPLPLPSPYFSFSLLWLWLIIPPLPPPLYTLLVPLTIIHFHQSLIATSIIFFPFFASVLKLISPRQGRWGRQGSSPQYFYILINFTSSRAKEKEL